MVIQYYWTNRRLMGDIVIPYYWTNRRLMDDMVNIKLAGFISPGNFLEPILGWDNLGTRSMKRLSLVGFRTVTTRPEDNLAKHYCHSFCVNLWKALE